MFRRAVGKISATFLLVGALAFDSHAADDRSQPAAGNIVDEVIQPLMREQNIPGMAVAVAINGENGILQLWGSLPGNRTTHHGRNAF